MYGKRDRDAMANGVVAAGNCYDVHCHVHVIIVYGLGQLVQGIFSPVRCRCWARVDRYSGQVVFRSEVWPRPLFYSEYFSNSYD